MKTRFPDLPAFDATTGDLNAIVDTPKGSRNKFKYDPRSGLFKLSGTLPLGNSFPFDFGYVPSTAGEDGDPLDVLILMDEPAFPGCLLKCRPIGIIEGEQRKKKSGKERNDRVVAIESRPVTD